MNRLLIRISPAAGSLPTAITETASTTASGQGGGGGEGGEGEKSRENAGQMKNCEEQERGKSEAGSSFSSAKKKCSECKSHFTVEDKCQCLKLETMTWWMVSKSSIYVLNTYSCM